MTLFREDLLAGRLVVLAGGVPDPLAATLGRVGADVLVLEPGEDAVGELPANVDALVYDAAAGFARGGTEGLRRCLDEAWSAVGPVATQRLIPAQRGKVVLVAPPPSAGPLAEAARRALENLARTLSVEWARFGITAAAVAAGPHASERDLALLLAYLLSPAGDYFSGGLIELGMVLGAAG